jgi:hypothetical protein
MKTHANLFTQVIDYQNIYNAARQTSRGKRFCPSVLKFNWELEANLLNLQQSLSHQIYQSGPYRPFMVYDSKKRQILAPTFPDRVVHSALYRIIEPVFDPGFISDSYACRKGKGTHRAIKRLQSFLKSAFMTINQSSVASVERERERVKLLAKFSPLKLELTKFLPCKATSATIFKMSTTTFFLI